MTASLDNLDITKKIKGSTTSVDAESLPGILPTPKKGVLDLNKFSVRYQKLDMDTPGDVVELERIESRAVKNDGIYLLSKKDYLFMDRIIILISYLEEDR